MCSNPGAAANEGRASLRLCSGQVLAGHSLNSLIPTLRRAGTLVLHLLQGCVGLGCDLVAHLPKIFVEKMLHALVEHLDGGTHRAHDPATDNSLRQLQVVEAEQVHALVEIQQALGDVVQSEKLLVAAVDIVH